MPRNASTSRWLQVCRASASSTKRLASSNALMDSSLFTAFAGDWSSALAVAGEGTAGAIARGCATELGHRPVKARETSWRSSAGSKLATHCAGADVGSRAWSSRVTSCPSSRSSRALARACQTALAAIASMGSASQVSSRDTFGPYRRLCFEPAHWTDCHGILAALSE